MFSFIKHKYLLFGMTITLSSFLIFLVQPLIGKYLLPWFGGSSAVWMISMLFFMSELLLGYAYANWLVKKFSIKKQVQIHMILLGISLVVIIFGAIFWESPITPNFEHKPSVLSFPIFRLIGMLFVGVGFPYLLLASHGSLLQSWFSKISTRAPYSLYALSNVGSFVAVISYFVLFEPVWKTTTQGWIWGVSFFVLIIMIWLCAKVVRSSVLNTKIKSESVVNPKITNKPSIKFILKWILLSTVPAAALLIFTNNITKNIAPVPMLWLVPMSIYLLSFILAFSDRVVYFRKIGAFALMVAVLCSMILHDFFSMFTGNSFLLLIIDCFVLFLCAFIFHRELYRLRPQSNYLTSYYFYISLGGVIGAILVSVLAPMVFKDYYEFPIILLCIAFAGFLIIKASAKKSLDLAPTFIMAGSILLVLCVVMFRFVLFSSPKAISHYRNFYGTLSINATSVDDGGIKKALTLCSGEILHGMQVMNSNKPTTYYSEDSGVGMAINYHPKRLNNKEIRVGVVGLGVGTLAAYSEPGDYFRFYEINPDVDRIAKLRFDYLANAKGEVDVVLGDGRLELVNEIQKIYFEPYDVFVLDAFSGDSIPVHLMTKEAFELYKRAVGDDGIIAFHISNKYLDLEPVVRGVASNSGWKGLVVHSERKEDTMKSSNWIILSKNEINFDKSKVDVQIRDLDYNGKKFIWTDKYSNILGAMISQILKD